ncbi:MAG: Ig-like domain-containing protein, partial [Myxococcaceae bacterium]
MPPQRPKRSFPGALVLAALSAQGAACRGLSVDPDRSSVGVDVAVRRADGLSRATITVTVRDADGNPLPGQTVTLAASGEGTELAQPDSPTDQSGAVQGAVASTRAGTSTVTATVGGTTLTQRPLVHFEPVAVRLAFTVPPSAATAGQPIVPSIQVSAVDVWGEAVAKAAADVTLAIDQGPAGAILDGNTRRLALSGVSTFDGVWLDRAGAGYVLSASAPGLGEVLSPVFDVASAPPPRLVFVTGPQGAVAGAAFYPPLRIALQHAQGGLVEGAVAQVSLGIGIHAGPGVLAGSISVTTVGAVATFPAVSIDRTGAEYTLVATAPGYTGATSSAFEVRPAAPARLCFLPGAPVSGTAGSPLSPPFKVQVQDAFGNQAPGFTGDVTAELGAAPGGATLSGPAVARPVGTVATFAGLGVDRAGTGYTLLARAIGLAPATSPAFSITAATPSGVSSTATVSPPGPLVADGAASYLFTVTVRDGLGNPISGAPVQLVPSGSGNTLVQPAATGLDGVTTGALASTRAGAQQVTVKVGALELASPVTVTFVAGPASDTASTVSASPSSVTADGVATTSVTITVNDAQGNPIAGLPVTLAASGTGNLLVQPTALTDPAGLATAALASTRAEAKTLFATVGTSLSIVQQPAVTFVAGPPSAGASTVVASPSTGVPADGIASSAITVTVLDAFLNPVQGQPVTLTVSGSGNLLTQ